MATKPTIKSLEARCAHLERRRNFHFTEASRWKRRTWIASSIAAVSLFSFCLLLALGFRLVAQPVNVSVTLPDSTLPASSPVGTPVGENDWTPVSDAKGVNAATPRVAASVNLFSCSGTIVAKTDTLALGVSAAHCCAGIDKTFAYGTVGGKTHWGRWVAIDRKNDLAAFVVHAKDVEGVAVVPASGVPGWTKPTDAVGYPGGKGPKYKRFRYRGSQQIRSSNGRFYRNVFSNLGPGRFGGGDSGGGVFYDGDHLVGVMTHSGQNCATLPQIRAFLASNKAAFRGIDPFKDCPDCDRRPGWRPSPNVPPGIGRWDSTWPDKTMTAAIKELQARLAKLEAAGVGKPGPPGPAGKDGVDGKPGPAGPAGVAGKDGAGIDPAELAALKLRLDSLAKLKIPVQILSPDGRVIDEDFYPLGKDGTFKPIKLRLYPAKK